MIYSYQVEKLVRQNFDNVNNHKYDELLKAVAPNVHHRFGGAHAIGGERHDKEAMRRWLERVGRVLPNLRIKVNNIWVKGWPWRTTVFVQWDATATLLNFLCDRRRGLRCARGSGPWPWRDAIGQEPRNGKMKNQHRRIQQSTRVTVRLCILGACQGVRPLRVLSNAP